MCRHLDRSAGSTLNLCARQGIRVATCVADTGVVDLDPDLARLGRRDLDVLDAQLLAGLPGDGGFASDGLEGEALAVMVPSVQQLEVLGWRGFQARRGGAHLAGS